MKSSYLLLSVIFSLVSLASLSQTKPTISKGYYSIGDNSQKLPGGLRLQQDSSSLPAHTKGYYSIGAAHNKESKRSRWLIRQGPKSPVTKGYYSIGDTLQRR